MTQQEVIKKFMKSLDNTSLSGEAALNEAIRACSNSQYSTVQSVINEMVSDCRRTNNSDTFLKTYCGINLSNTDTGAITGKDAGGSTTKTKSSIVPESGGLQYFTDNSFKANGFTFQLAKFSGDSYSTTTFYDLDNYEQKYIWQALYTWWAKNSLNLISQSYGSNFGSSNSRTTTKTIYFGFFNDSSDALASTGYRINSSGNTTFLRMRVNMNYYDDINTYDPDGSSTATKSYLDLTLAHELTHATMAANIKNFTSLPVFIREGMAELTPGGDFQEEKNIKTVAGNATALNTALDVDITNSNNAKPYTYAAGYMFLRYIAKKFSTSSSPTVPAAGFTSGPDYYNNSTSNTVLSALGGNDTVSNSATNVVIYGNNGNDSLSNYGSRVKLYGNNNNDYLYSNYQASNVTLSGGAGKDRIYLH